MNTTSRSHANPEIKLRFIEHGWTPVKLSYRATQNRIHRNVTRTCTRCLGSGHYFNHRCETCSGWGVLMVLRGHNDIRRST
jgi:hypothetical protein